MVSFHLAQLNIAKVRAPIGDPVMAEFVDNLERVNRLGDESPGFVWRFQTDAGDATSVHAFDDPDILLNLTVWESVDALKAFVYKSEHVEFLRRRREWFVPSDLPTLSMWWIPAGELPTIDDAVRRHLHLAEHGPSEVAFPFSSIRQPPVAVDT